MIFYPLRNHNGKYQLIIWPITQHNDFWDADCEAR
jgi:hypothetical protein